MTACVVLVTAPSLDVARDLARTIVSEGLAACANLSPGVKSVYTWQGELQEDEEVLMVIKTRQERIPALEARLSGLHPYDVPEFVVLRAEHVAEPYLAWLEGATA